MTYDANVPNGGQSPGLFPVQNNTNYARLKTIISGDHIFNDTAANDDGCHKQVTLANRVDPSSVPTGTNSMVYGKAATDSVNELWFYDSVTPRQLNWRVLTGTVSLPKNSYTFVVAVPANMYGFIYLYSSTGLWIQSAQFVSDGSVVRAFSNAEKYADGSGSAPIVRFDMNGANGLNIRAYDENTGTAPLTWTYQIFYRQK